MSERLFVCTDLDRTLIPNGPQPESDGARERFAAFAARDEVCLAYVSGRHRALVEEAIDRFALPVPDFVVGDVGTSIYHVGGGWAFVDAWEERIAADWAGHSRVWLAGLLADIQAGMPQMRLQEDEKQGRFKLSYYTPADADAAGMGKAAEQRLASAGIRCRAVASIDEQAGCGLLDVLPASASKLHAIEFLMGELGYDTSATVFCGDSGNDLEVLASRIPAVLVANAMPEVRELAVSRSAAMGFSDRLYVAEGGLFGMNGFYAAGMLEGIAHYHPASRAWMEVA